eukprot:CAMPEP_0167746166 /NCGR_PEP_ID=MMETSP0110_2-20121227/3561_1 /TAXON_ID=629695 /ORGANISM="Gymnochlora sp., Strain CCMP2014" /LENGTH=331 /DNA_ID=CAMNT_0007630899 /DNA_START=91 /DNA_END=1086 /DNA_ORIENTATION=-
MTIARTSSLTSAPFWQFWRVPQQSAVMSFPVKISPEKSHKLYVFDHCEYCTRARMIYGLKNIAVDIVFVMYDKGQKLIDMAGKRITPILQIESEIKLESLDIVKWVDEEFGAPILLPGSNRTDIAEWLHDTAMLRRKLTRPRFVRHPLPEFTQRSARDEYIFTHPFTAGCARPPTPYSAPAENFNASVDTNTSEVSQNLEDNNESSPQDSEVTTAEAKFSNSTKTTTIPVFDMTNCVEIEPDLDDMKEEYEEKFRQTPQLLRKINSKLKELTKMVFSENHASGHGLSYDDIALFPALRPLSLIKGISLGRKLSTYMYRMSLRSDVPLFHGI